MFIRLKGSRVFGIPGNANLWKAYLAVDIAGRAIYAIDGLLGNAWRYNKEASAVDACHPDTKTCTVQWIRHNSAGPLGRLTAHDQVYIAGDD